MLCALMYCQNGDLANLLKVAANRNGASLSLMVYPTISFLDATVGQ